MRVATLCLIGLAFLTVASGTVVATENSPPLASAGLDQTVPPNTTVYLDASGSVDPDGEITGYEWTVQAPSGATRSPSCGSCQQTEFDVDTAGRYAVTLTVTDNDGASRSDTLYVTVETDGPTVSLTGPASTTPDSQTVLTATASADNASLRTLAWVVDGDVLERVSLSGSQTTRSLRRSFTTGESNVTAVAYDTLGRRDTATQTLTVGRTDGGLGTGNGCGPDGDTWAGLCTGGGDALISTPDGTQYILNSNGEPGVQLPGDSGEGLQSYSDPTSSESISRRDSGSDLYVIDDDVSVGGALDQTDTVQEESADGSSTDVDTTQSGPEGFNKDKKESPSDDQTITQTTQNVLSNLGITAPEPPLTDNRDDGDDSSGDSSTDDTNNNSGDSNSGADDSDASNDESADNESDGNDTGDSGMSGTYSRKADNSDTKSDGEGFVGL